VGNRITDENDAFEQLLVGLVEVAEREGATEKGLGAIVGEVVRSQST
jgi:hypothetical protein